MKQTLLLLTTVGTLALGGCMGGEKKETPAEPNASTAPVAVANLCDASEKVLFSCLVAREGKLLSVCASANLTASTGYLQYRYGVNASNLDMNFPTSRDNTHAAFKLNGDTLSFQNGSITYQVDASGVKILWAKSPERNKNLACAGAAINNLSSLSGIVQ